MPNKGIIEMQLANANWAPIGFFDGNKTSINMSGPSGGGQQQTTTYARDYDTGELVEVDVFNTGTPTPYTFNLTMPFSQVETFLKLAYGRKAIRFRVYNTEFANPFDYQIMRVYPKSREGDESFNQDFTANVTDPNDQLRRVLAFTAPAMLEVRPITHARVAASLTDEALNAVIAVGGRDYDTNNDGNQEFIAGGAKSGAGQTANLAYTDDKWATSKELALTGATDFNVKGLAKAGGNIIMVGDDTTGGGVFYVSLADIRAQASAVTPTRATGISAGTAVNCVVAVSSTLLYAGGDAGAIYKSVDGGLTWTTIASGSVNNLESVAAFGEALVWFGGASATVVKVVNGTPSVVTATGLSGTVNAIAVPKRKRGIYSEVYLGSSTGQVVRSIDTGATWEIVFAAGSGAIDGLAFAGHEGAYLYVIQSNGSSQSRILRDHSGGKMGGDAEVIGSYTDPANATLNAIVASDVNTVVVVGDVQTAKGFIGLAQAA